MKTNRYSAENIQVLEGLEAVRKRPGMYIGDSGSFGLHQMIFEIVDNSVDEIINGYGDTIIVTYYGNNKISIQDNGRGIPVGIHKKYNCPAVEIIFIKLHSGGKFNENAYKSSGGLHGVGASVVNALSDFVNVRTIANKKEYEIEFSNGGKISKKLTKASQRSKNFSSGTIVTFHPDPLIFAKQKFIVSQIVHRLKEKAYLNKSLTIFFCDKTNPKNDCELHFENGLISYLKQLIGDKKIVIPPFLVTDDKEFKNSDIICKCAVSFCNNYEENIISFANCVRTPGGGSHEIGFKIGITKAVNEYLKTQTYTTKLKQIDGGVLRHGIHAIIDVRLTEKYLQFEGQTKDRLSSNDVKNALANLVHKRILFLLQTNPNVAKRFIEQILHNVEIKKSIDQQKKLMRQIKTSGKAQIFHNIKLSPAHSKKNEICEIFLVEGESAGGSAKQGRDSKFQAILPLKGKIVNAKKSSVLDVLKNDEIQSLVQSLETNFGDNFNLGKLRYHKIIIMTDADDDGAHIQILLLTFFYVFMKTLIINGNIFLAVPPLFKVKTTKGDKYFYTNDELNNYKKALSKPQSFSVQRYKGLGEMNPIQLWETTMNPETRTLIRVTLKDFEKQSASEELEVLMGTDIAGRKEWIANNIDFTIE